MKIKIETKNAPQAIGVYSQAVKMDHHVYISGQIPLDPETMEMVTGDIDAEINRVFDNIAAVITAAGGELSDILKLTIYLTDLTHFPRVNEAMSARFVEPYPARAVIGVSALPKGARVEADAIMALKKP